MIQNPRTVFRRLRPFLGLTRDAFWADDERYQVRLREHLFELLKPHAKTLTFERRGVLWSGATDDGGISKKLFAKGKYHLEYLEGLLAYLSHHGFGTRKVAVDVGANVGIPSLPMARLSDFDIVAIEPLPSAFQLLVQNVTQNGFEDRIRCMKLAIGERKETAEMVTRGTISSLAEFRLPGGEQGYGPRSPRDQSVTVTTERLDDLLRGLDVAPDSVAMVWSDTQGSEATVLGTGESLWQAGVPFYCEVWPHGLRLHGGVARFLDLVKKHFGSYVTRDELADRRHEAAKRPIESLADLMSGLDTTDLLFLPR